MAKADRVSIAQILGGRVLGPMELGQDLRLSRLSREELDRHMRPDSARALLASMRRLDSMEIVSSADLLKASCYSLTGWRKRQICGIVAGNTNYNVRIIQYGREPPRTFGGVTPPARLFHVWSVKLMYLSGCVVCLP